VKYDDNLVEVEYDNSKAIITSDSFNSSNIKIITKLLEKEIIKDFSQEKLANFKTSILNYNESEDKDCDKLMMMNNNNISVIELIDNYESPSKIN